MAFDVFISHSSADEEVAHAVCLQLETAGIRCWIAPRNIVPGRSYAEAIANAISSVRLMVVVISAQAVVSRHVIQEVRLAAENGLAVFPLRIDSAALSAELDFFLGLRHWLEAVPPEESHYLRLVDSVQAHLRVPTICEAPRGTGESDQAVPASPVPQRGRKPRWAYVADQIRAIYVQMLERLKTTRTAHPPVAACHRRGNPEIPGGKGDPVHFTITSPPMVRPGASFLIDVWAHLECQREQVLERARKEAGKGPVQIKGKGPVRVARGTVLTVNLQVGDFTVDPLEDTILWEDEVGNATFVLAVPAFAPAGTRHAVAKIHSEGLEVARVNFLLRVGQRLAPREALPMHEQRYRTAFCSYASEDGDAVLARIQGMQKVMPGLNVFYASAALHSGERWQTRLREEILRRDVMYLFWSEAASRSRWVEWEWRCGFRERGIDFIDPCPLVSPDSVPPPKELADHLHFNDWTLAYMRSAGPSVTPQ